VNWIVVNLWLIPAMPLLAAAVISVAKQPHRRFAASLGIGSMVLAFFLSCAAFAQTLGGHSEAARQVHHFDWFALGETTLKLGWLLDPLSAAMLVMVSFVGLLIFIYSVGYMAQDENFTRFFCFLSLFAAAMLGVVMANSLLLLFICWELVGFASYILIGFWYYKPSAAAAAKKAFITTRVGDVFFFLGLLWLYAETGTLLFYDGGAGCLEQSALAKLVGQTTFIGMAVSTAIALLIFCGAIGKSGQVPLHVWLPDAMEGPTPVSALIHAATMVAAGVFLVARLYPLMEVTTPSGPVAAQAARLMNQVAAVPGQPLTPSEGEREQRSSAAGEANIAKKSQPPERRDTRETALSLPKGEGWGEGKGEQGTPASANVSTARKAVTWIGAITAVFAALIAVAQTDIKRILAYSTVSQLGFMFIGLGAGGVAVGMFHLLTHAFFKALLFLGAGSVIHGCHDEQDIRRMGSLKKFMPVTFATYAIGMMALAGFPLVTSGFWSKDEILHAAALWPSSKWPFLMGLAGAFLTALYMTRQIWYVFFGSARSCDREVAGTSQRVVENEASPPAHAGSDKPHESPAVMTIPLVVLAVGAVGLSVFGTPVWPWFHSYLSGHPPRLMTSIEVSTLLIMLFSSVMALGGIALGGWLYSRRGPQKAEAPDPLEELQPDIFATLRGKFFIDELYEISVIRWSAACARACRWLDETVWDNAVRAVALLTLGLSWLNRLLDEFVVNLGFDQGCGGLRLGARLLSLWQNGQVQRYLRVIGLALAIFIVIFIWGCK
jgi:NADH:ubiquinone oxidoreductase subunit 5 (subunit L)/multisubunit Na+/H+ antiporter MnhA subunit